MRSAMHRNDTLSGSGRTGYACWAVKVSFNRGSLRWMQKHQPLRPRLLQRLRHGFLIAGNPETTLSVGMREWIGEAYRYDRTRLRSFAGSQSHKRFLRFLWQPREEVKQPIIVYIADELQIAFWN